jgi:5-methyltetrahydropteroyltriglutamate--homocysteine methyltransferase
MRSRGEVVDDEELRGAVAVATADVIRAQLDAGIDIGNDGEQARESFFTYLQHRMTGFAGKSQRPLMRDLLDHPDYIELALPRFARMKVDLMGAPAAEGDVTYRDDSEVAAECDLIEGAPFGETFMTAASPGIVCSAMENRHYPTMAEYVEAVANALSTEYRYIVDRGLLLQVDAPDLAMERHVLFAECPLSEFLAWVDLVVTALNRALSDIDPTRVRLHVCWGNYEGPHTLDVPIEDILPIIYNANV